MKDLIEFLKSKVFLINFGIAVLLVFLSTCGTLTCLDVYTGRGDVITVKDFRGAKLAELDALFAAEALNYKVSDTVYVLGKPKGSVIEQHPGVGSSVKENRTIYLTVNALQPKMISMPRLVDQSRAFALSQLSNLGLEVKELTYKPDLCKDCVLEQIYKGKPIDVGTMIPRGAMIKLVLGMGKSNTKTTLPHLYGLTINEARQRLNEHQLNLGADNYEGCTSLEDSLSAKVYVQNPKYYNEAEISMGSEVDVRLTCDTVGMKLPEYDFELEESEDEDDDMNE